MERFSLEVNGRVWHSFLTLGMICGSEKCLEGNKLEILRDTERVMISALCSVNLVDKQNAKK